MAMPKSKSARLFYRASLERLTDAHFLYEKANRTTAAVYLAGYAVECVLKALILSQLPAKEVSEMVKQFRGGKAHDYDWLKHVYRDIGGPVLPKPIVEAFVVVEDWGTEMRYNPGRIDPEDAEVFLSSAKTIIQWADGRL
jgi:HEPN domain-containing protein